MYCIVFRGISPLLSERTFACLHLSVFDIYNALCIDRHTYMYTCGRIYARTDSCIQCDSTPDVLMLR